MKQLSVAKTVLRNEKNEVLVLRRSPWPGQPERDHQPDFPGGRVESGETEREAAAREMKEEAGIEVREQDLRLLYTRTRFFEDKGESVSHFLYTAQLPSTPEVTISFEHEAFEWVPFEKVVSDYEFNSFYAEALAYISQNKLV